MISGCGFYKREKGLGNGCSLGAQLLEYGAANWNLISAKQYNLLHGTDVTLSFIGFEVLTLICTFVFIVVWDFKHKMYRSQFVYFHMFKWIIIKITLVNSGGPWGFFFFFNWKVLYSRFRSTGLWEICAPSLTLPPWEKSTSPPQGCWIGP